MMRRSLSVAFLTSARSWRGSGVSFSHIALGLAERGHRVHMLAGEPSVVDGFLRQGLPGTSLPTGNTGLAGVRALAASLRALAADCLVVDRPRDLRLGALAALIHPIALVNRYNLSRLTPPRDLLSRLAYLAVRLTIFVSHTSARQALERASYLRRRPHRVIMEGVGAHFHPNPEAAAQFRASYQLGFREFLLAVGSLTADKRYPFLFDALSLLGGSAPPLLICGAGPLQQELQRQAAALNLDVRFLGLVSPELLPGAYSAAIALVHACAIETFGLSVLEAMACGRPVLAVEGGAVPEVLSGTGMLSPPSDSRGFSDRLRQLLDSPDRRLALGTAARERASEFSLSKMQEAYSEAVEDVCPFPHRALALDNARAAPPGL